MANILEIKKYPEAVLRAKSLPVEKIDEGIKYFLSDMAITMHASSGVGLAAPQVGVNKQIAVIDIGEGLIKLINPKILERKGRSCIEEGCLSVPEVAIKIKRAAHIKVNALDENGKRLTINADGLLAIVMQHEIDHLNGVLIIDYPNFIKRKFIKRRLSKLKSRRII